MARTANSLKPYNISVLVTGTASKAYSVKAKNLRTGESVIVSAVPAGKSGEHEGMFNLAEARIGNGDPSGYQIGDIIEVSVSGQGYGSGTIIVQSSTTSGGDNLKITATDHTTALCGVSI